MNDKEFFGGHPPGKVHYLNVCKQSQDFREGFTTTDPRQVTCERCLRLIQEDTFFVDELNSDHQYLCVNVAKKGVVQIKNEDEGIVVDICPYDVSTDESGEPVASTWAHDNDLIWKEEEDTPVYTLTDTMRQQIRQWLQGEDFTWKEVASKGDQVAFKAVEAERYLALFKGEELGLILDTDHLNTE